MDGGWCSRGAFAGLDMGEGGWLSGRGGEAESGRLYVMRGVSVYLHSVYGGIVGQVWVVGEGGNREGRLVPWLLIDLMGSV